MVCVVAALKKEIDRLLDSVAGLRKERAGSCVRYEGSISGRRARILRTGMGRPDGSVGFYEGCSLLISTGFCGALSPLLAKGDLVVSTAVMTRKKTGGTPGDRVKREIRIPSRAERSVVDAARDIGASLHFGPTFTADRIVRTAEEKEALHRESGALSVDMEDSLRLEAAESLGVPFMSVRIVLDGHDEDLPSFRSAFRAPSGAAALARSAALRSRELASLLVRFIEKFEKT